MPKPDYDVVKELEKIANGEYKDADVAIRTLARCVIDLNLKVQQVLADAGKVSDPV